jgi:hypothetical protein
MRTMPLIAFTLLIAVSLAGASETPRLAGLWTPDAAEYRVSKRLKDADVNAPPAPPAPSGESPSLPDVRIQQNDRTISFEYFDDEGDVLSLLTFTTDGKENRNERAGGALMQKSTSGWVDGALRTAWRLERGQQVVISGVDLWRLSGNGQTLTVTSTIEDSKSVSETKTVYRRR